MKQIPDVEKLKEAIDADGVKLIRTYGLSHEHMISKVLGRCKMLADELAVEVPESSIYTLAEEQKDLDPRIPPMVNEKFWELVGDKPEAKPGAKPGAIDLLIDLVQSTHSIQEDFDLASSARAELAQLQARITEADMLIKGLIANQPDFMRGGIYGLAREYLYKHALAHPTEEGK